MTYALSAVVLTIMKKLSATLKSSLYTGSALLCLGLVSCANTTPESRIENNQQLHDSLSAKDRELVQAGKIDTGMSKEAVFLAWGKPDRESEISENGQLSTRWDYNTLQPVVSQSFHGGYGYGFGSSRFGHRSRFGGSKFGKSRFRRRGHFSSSHFGIGTGISYVPVSSATVLFENNSVKSWRTRK